MKKFMHRTIEDKYKEDYYLFRKSINIKGLIRIGFFILFVQLAAVTGFYISPFSSEAYIMHIYFTFYLSSIFFNVSFLFLLHYIRNHSLLNTNLATFSIISYVFVLHFWGMGVAVADQVQEESVVVYFFGMFVLSIMLNISTFEFATLLIIVQAIFVITILKLQAYFQVDFEIINASFQYVFLSILLRSYLSRLTDKDYIRRKKLEELNNELTYLSYNDSLSELYNRRRWEYLYQEKYAIAYSTSNPLAVILLDIDYFKEYNDYYGHIKGDEVIRAVSKVVKDITTAYGGESGRYGGDELVIAILHVQLEELQAFKSTIKTTIDSLAIPHVMSLSSDILSVSIGSYYAIPHSSNGEWEFLSEADRDLYHQKNLRPKK